MSIEVCAECDHQVDTDYNVEGSYEFDRGYVCEDCMELDDKGKGNG